MKLAFPLRPACLALALAGFLSETRADVRLPALFTDHMVLQHGSSVPVWGWADDGEKVTVEFAGQSVATEASDGKWRVRLAPIDVTSESTTLVVRGKNTIEIKDVLVGEVWVASGQSNMEWPLSRSFEPEDDISSANNGQIRLFTVPKTKSQTPLDDVRGEWKRCSPDAARNFSAVAYYFGRELQKQLGVPVGIIHTSWGGSPAEAWMRREVLDAYYADSILPMYERSWANYQNALARHESAKATNPNARPPGMPWRASELYNGMIAPLIPYAIKGAIWYQGESNASRAHQYRSLFTEMIRNWRADWNQGSFPFLAVQLAPWDKNRRRSLEEITAAPGESDWAELREAQMFATRELSNVGVVVITDVGDKDDIHPTKKQPVGERLALAALGIAYDRHLAWSGPVFDSMRIEGNKAVIRFDFAENGLEARGGPLTGFAIAGEDRKFVWADAVIDNDQVIVSSPHVSKPVAVRYGWADYPVVNLWNKDGLPASPFRTDDFPMVTAPKEPGR